MKVVISVEAEADMEAIGDYIARHSPSAAQSLIGELRTRCLDLGLQPRRFPLVPRYERHGVRRRVHSNYLIFYRIDEQKIVVLHILHGATDYAAMLFPDATPD